MACVSGFVLPVNTRGVAMSESNTKQRVERDLLQAVDVYEQECLFKKHGKRQRAQRTRNSIRDRGVIEAVNRIVSKKKAADGYLALAAIGKAELTFEAVILRYPQFFKPKAISRSTERIKGRPKH